MSPTAAGQSGTVNVTTLTTALSALLTLDGNPMDLVTSGAVTSLSAVTPASVQAATGTPVFPSPAVLATTQSRAAEKGFLAREGLPCAPFLVVEKPDGLMEALRSLFPLHGFEGSSLSDASNATKPVVAIAKTLRGGYDGKGQVVVREPADFERVLPLLPCVLEEALDLAFEASVITARTQQGNAQSFPVFENIHVNNILDTTLFPSPSLPRGKGREGGAAEVLLRVAESCAHRLDLVGLLTTEFFLSRKTSKGLFSQGGLSAVPGTSLFFGINEFAPRPHNSGHVTREACFVSQFDALAHVLLNLPLPSLEPVSAELFAMGNLLGDVWISQGQARGDLAPDAAEAPGDSLSLAPWADAPDVLAITLYGKETARKGRKMGHFTLRLPQARSQVTEFRTALANSTARPPFGKPKKQT